MYQVSQSPRKRGKQQFLMEQGKIDFLFRLFDWDGKIKKVVLSQFSHSHFSHLILSAISLYIFISTNHFIDNLPLNFYLHPI